MNGIKFDAPQILGYVGAVLLGLSVLAPMIRVVVVTDIFATDVDFFAWGFGDGPLFVAVAAAAFYFTYSRLYSALAWTAAAAAVVLAVSLYHVYLLLELPKRAGNLPGGLMGRLLGGLADWLTGKIIHFGWGWILLGVGIACLVGAAFLPAETAAGSGTVSRTTARPVSSDDL